MTEALTPEQLEARLRAIGAERYHDRHPFHHLLHAGKLDRAQVQAWALNRYYYQSRIPLKDAALMSRLEDRKLRRAWRQRVLDHDGDDKHEGGIERWLKLTEGLGLDRAYVEGGFGVLPATRFAVDAYVRFVRERSLVEAIASSLTEMFSPAIIADRVAGMLKNYSFIDKAALAYFDHRLEEAPRDVELALDYVKSHARTPELQQAVVNALVFKCDVLWAQLDALHHAYVEPGHIPPGAFRPGEGRMNVSNPLPGEAVPRLPKHVRMRHDEHRSAWVLLAPEKVIVLDEIGVEILKRCTGASTVSQIVEDLSRTFGAPRATVARDVAAFLIDLKERNLLLI